MPEPVWPKPPAAALPQGRVNLMVGERELTTGLLAKEAALVPRSHRRCRPQGCRFNSAGISFGFAGRGDLLALPFRPLLSRSDPFRRPRKSGGPPLFAPSLKVQGDDTHNQLRVFRSTRPYNALTALKVLGVEGTKPPPTICKRH